MTDSVWFIIVNNMGKEYIKYIEIKMCIWMDFMSQHFHTNLFPYKIVKQNYNDIRVQFYLIYTKNSSCLHLNHCIQTTFAKVCNWLPFIADFPFRQEWKCFCYSNLLIAVYREIHTVHCWFELMMSSLHKLLMNDCCLNSCDIFKCEAKNAFFTCWF